MNKDELQNATILVVDDEPANLGVLFEYLGQHNLTVLIAEDGQDALDKARRLLPDLILLDILLPDIDGFDVCRQLKAEPKTQDIPVLFITALTDMDNKIKGFEAGGVDYITKPFRKAEVLVRVTTHLTVSHLQKRLRQQNSFLQIEIDERLRVEGALQKAHDELEQRVDERTAELAQTNTLLQAEIEQHQQTEKALRESEVKYRTLVETAEDSIILTSLDQKILFRNRAAVESLGYTVEEWVEQDMLFNVHPEDRAQMASEPTDSIPEGPFTTEYRLQHKDGHWVHRLAKSVIVRNSQGHPYAVLTISRDVTEQKQLEEMALRNERLAAVGQLAAGIAHDFNNILSGITLYTDLLLHGDALSERQHKYLQTIAQQSKRAAALIQQILDFSRRSAIERQPLDMLYTLQEVHDLLSHTLPENILIQLNSCPEKCVTSADSGRMQQLFMNLALNARDAMPHGGQLTISLDHFWADETNKPLPTMADGKWVRVIVEDNGIGIPDDAFEHLFEPFYTTKSPGHGTGLGLAQVYGIIKQHEGFVCVNSRVDEGTRFTIYLPATGDKSIQDDTTAVPNLIHGRGETILVVEDDEVTREAIVTSLQSLNYHILVAEQGEKALNILTQNHNDIALVLSDIIMPQMNGSELLAIMKEQKIAIPVIMLSGYFMATELEHLRELGMVDWLPKPPKLERLAQVVHQAIHDN